MPEKVLSCSSLERRLPRQKLVLTSEPIADIEGPLPVTSFHSSSPALSISAAIFMIVSNTILIVTAVTPGRLGQFLLSSGR